MEFTKGMKILEQRRILVLSCYKSKKESKPISECCPFTKTEINDGCKNCIWFKATDVTSQVKEWMKEKEIEEGIPVVLDLKEIVHDNIPKPGDLKA